MFAFTSVPLLAPRARASRAAPRAARAPAAVASAETRDRVPSAFAAATLAATLVLAPADPAAATTVFAGKYIDPNHPHCPREIDADGVITGIDPVPFVKGPDAAGTRRRTKPPPSRPARSTPGPSRLRSHPTISPSSSISTRRMAAGNPSPACGTVAASSSRMETSGPSSRRAGCPPLAPRCLANERSASLRTVSITTNPSCERSIPKTRDSPAFLSGYGLCGLLALHEIGLGVDSREHPRRSDVHGGLRRPSPRFRRHPPRGPQVLWMKLFLVAQSSHASTKIRGILRVSPFVPSLSDLRQRGELRVAPVVGGRRRWVRAGRVASGRGRALGGGGDATDTGFVRSVARVSHSAILARRPRALPVLVRTVFFYESRIREVVEVLLAELPARAKFHEMLVHVGGFPGEARSPDGGWSRRTSSRRWRERRRARLECVGQRSSTSNSNATSCHLKSARHTSYVGRSDIRAASVCPSTDTPLRARRASGRSSHDEMPPKRGFKPVPGQQGLSGASSRALAEVGTPDLSPCPSLTASSHRFASLQASSRARRKCDPPARPRRDPRAVAYSPPPRDCAMRRSTRVPPPPPTSDPVGCPIRPPRSRRAPPRGSPPPARSPRRARVVPSRPPRRARCSHPFPPPRAPASRGDRSRPFDQWSEDEKAAWRAEKEAKRAAAERIKRARQTSRQGSIVAAMAAAADATRDPNSRAPVADAIPYQIIQRILSDGPRGVPPRRESRVPRVARRRRRCNVHPIREDGPRRARRTRTAKSRGRHLDERTRRHHTVRSDRVPGWRVPRGSSSSPVPRAAPD